MAKELEDYKQSARKILDSYYATFISTFDSLQKYNNLPNPSEN